MIDLRPYCVAQYKMNDNAVSGVVADSSGNGNNGLYYNGDPVPTSTGSVMGKINKALTVNGDALYVHSLHSFQSTFRNSFSITLWLGLPTGANSDYGFLSNATNVANSSMFAELLSAIVEGDIVYGFDILYIDNSGRQIQPVRIPVYSTEEMFPGGWCFIVIIMDKITHTFYMSANNQTPSQVTRNDLVMDDYSPSNLLIGTAGEWTAGYIGAIDNLCIFSKALSTDEIAFLWNGGNGTEELFEQESGAIMNELSEMWSW